MNQQEFFIKWKNKYPKSFKKFRLNYFKRDGVKNVNPYIKNDISLFSNGTTFHFPPLEYFSGIIESFFENNNIICLAIVSQNCWNGFVNIFNNNFNDVRNFSISFITKQEAQISAYLKAAEIMEKELNK